MATTPTTPHKSLDLLFAQGAVVVLDGKTHKLAKLTNLDFAEFVSACKGEQLKTFYTVMDAVPPGRQSEVIARVLMDSWSDQHMIDEVGTVAGATWVMDRSLKNAGEEITSAVMEHKDRMDKAIFVLVLSGILNKNALLLLAAEIEGEGENPPRAGDTTGDQSSPK